MKTINVFKLGNKKMERQKSNITPVGFNDYLILSVISQYGLGVLNERFRLLKLTLCLPTVPSPIGKINENRDRVCRLDTGNVELLLSDSAMEEPHHSVNVTYTRS
jgi:hypothetical protein